MRRNPPEARRPGFFGKVVADWGDRPVWIVGGGPSLKPHLAGLHLWPDQLGDWTRPRVLGVNRAADHVHCDATFSLDRLFVQKYAGRLRAWASQRQEVCVAVSLDWQRQARLVPGVLYLEREHGRGLSDDPGKIRNGLNSGYGALNYALLKGAREIVLLGYDLDERSGGHWHDGYEWAERVTSRYFTRWAERFSDAAKELGKFPGARVLNANPDSAVRAFPFTSYAELGL